MNRITALILDWAGTTVDFGSFAPTQIFVEAFHQAFDVDITLPVKRSPDYTRTLPATSRPVNSINAPEITSGDSRPRWSSATPPTAAPQVLAS